MEPMVTSGRTDAETALALERDDAPAVGLRRLSAALGAEVLGLDEVGVDSPEVGRFLERALLDHQLLLLRGLALDATAFRRIARRLGPLRRVPQGMETEPGLVDVQHLSNLARDGTPIRSNPDPYAVYWHTDGSATRIPSRYTVFYALRIPERGGETSFADMYAACAALSAAYRRSLVGRVAVHDPDLARYFRYGTPIVPAGVGFARAAWRRMRFAGRLLSPGTARHPVLRVHEETGRPCLFLGANAWRVTGRTWASGARLVDELNEFATSEPSWTHTHRWRVGDLVVWDNRCLLHRGSEYDTARQERVMLRAVVDGVGAPIAAPM